MPLPAHRIRLRGPWRVTIADGSQPPTQMAIPCSLREGGWVGVAGRVSFYRRFGRPSNLGPTESVWLVLEHLATKAEVRLNEKLMGDSASSREFDITGILLDRNEVSIAMQVADDAGGLVGEVVLEIRVASEPAAAGQ